MALRIIEQTLIPPSPPLSEPLPPQPLSFLDKIWIRDFWMEWVFFYHFPHSVSHFLHHHLPTLTASLSLTLRSFYPLAGTIRRSPDSEDEYVIAFAEGDAVSFTVAELAGADFSSLSGYHPREFEKLQLLAPKTSSISANDTTPQWPVMSVQVTLFPLQGLCVGVSVHHAACDGSGAMHFIKSWAAACRSAGGFANSAPPQPPPFLDRSVIVDSRGVRSKLLKARQNAAEKAQKQQNPAAKPSPERMICGTFVLDPAMIGRLKKTVMSSVSEGERWGGLPNFHCSSFVVSCAYVWRCLFKARGYDYSEAAAEFAYAVDWRPRMTPAIPAGYIGNCVAIGTAEVRAGELAGEEGLSAAASAIGRSVGALEGVEVGEMIERIVEKFVEFEMEERKPLSTAGSPKFGVYETEFGWGRPAKVDLTSIVETGAISLVESGEGDGGIEIGIFLPEDELAKFTQQFVGGLHDL